MTGSVPPQVEWRPAPKEPPAETPSRVGQRVTVVDDFDSGEYDDAGPSPPWQHAAHAAHASATMHERTPNRSTYVCQPLAGSSCFLLCRRRPACTERRGRGRKRDRRPLLGEQPHPPHDALHALGLEQAARSKLWITRESTSPRNKVSPRHALNWSSAHWQVRPRSKTLAGGSGRVATSWWYEQTALVVRHRPSALCRPHPRDPTPARAPSSPCRSPRCLKPLSVLELSSTSR